MEALRTPTAQRVLLAVDLKSPAKASIDEAIRRAAADGAALIVLSVVERASLRLPGGRMRRVDQERNRLEAGARDIVTTARTAGVSATYLVWEGDPAESIVEASSAEKADVIVLGSRPRTDLRKILHGSVSSQVTHTATCEVVVVPD
ncbi:MAG: universal stress protein [Chloroflexota bacterium]